MKSVSKLAIAAILLSTSASFAATYNLSDDFSNDVGADNPWSYGTYGLGGDYTTFSTFTQVTNVEGLGLDGYEPTRFFGILQNTGTSQVTRNGTQFFDPGAVVIHPNSNGEVAVVRWTAQEDTSLTLAGSLDPADIFSTEVGFNIFDEGTSLFSTAINSGNPNDSFSLAFSVSAGDRIDFVLDWGADNSWVFDAIDLSAEFVTADVSAVPLPASLPALLAGLGAFGALRSRRKS
ncbi:MAG: VPLPA-CTERM sorting domain-containing protein [Paracoccaceae bacterium]